MFVVITYLTIHEIQRAYLLSYLLLYPFTDTPEQPQNVRATETNSRNLTLEWVEPYENNAPIHGYRVTYSDPPFLAGGGVVVEVVQIEVAVITGLHPGVTYNFIVVAFNEIGDSDPSVVTMVATLEEGMCVITSDMYCCV